MNEFSTEFTEFERSLRAPSAPLDALRDGVIGKNAVIDTPTGPKPLIYADYVASGRALKQVEDFVSEHVLPYYANSHTEQSFCGARMTRLRAEARAIIAAQCNAPQEDYAVIFGGSGATTGINQLVHLFGAARQPTVLLHGPYEHHSNLLPWRESGAQCIEIKEDMKGGVDLAHLHKTLRTLPQSVQIIGSFSAAANVTGICTNPIPVSKLIHDFGGKVIWDYAGGAPYLPMSMVTDQTYLDAVVFSPHKFIGGPAASGVLLVRRDSVVTKVPARPGGGTVVFVNQQKHDYVAGLEQREEGGTPNVIGDIRAALAMIVNDVIGQDYLENRNRQLSEQAFAAWSEHPQIKLLAPDHRNRLPILSFVPLDQDGAPICYQAFTRALSEDYGIQARGGCSCAGPYVHRLLAISETTSTKLRRALRAGNTSNKPGFVRLNLSVLMSNTEVQTILKAVPALAERLSARKVA